MRRSPLLVPVLAAALLMGTAPAQGAPTTGLSHLTVMNYNIHTGIGFDGVLDLERTAEQIRASGADVVGLEEVDVHWSDRSQYRDEAAELAGLLGMNVFFAPIYDLPPATEGAPNRQFGVAVLSKLPILATENHEITRLSTQDPNPVPAPAPGFAEVVLKARGGPLHVYVTHLDYRADPAVRVAQVADTLTILDEDRRGEPQLLLGDLNATADSAELAPLLARMQDAWRGPGGLTYPADVPVERIDYVTGARGVFPLHSHVPETLASDHRPMVADVLVHA